jgi:hypothetical protein
MEGVLCNTNNSRSNVMLLWTYCRAHVHTCFVLQLRPGRGEFHENPAACICEKPEAKEKLKLWRAQQAKKPKVEKVQESIELKAKDPVLPVEDRLLEADDDADEDAPLVIEDEQSSNESDGSNLELLLEEPNDQDTSEGGDSGDGDGDGDGDSDGDGDHY